MDRRLELSRKTSEFPLVPRTLEQKVIYAAVLAAFTLTGLNLLDHSAKSATLTRQYIPMVYKNLGPTECPGPIFVISDTGKGYTSEARINPLCE